MKTALQFWIVPTPEDNRIADLQAKVAALEEKERMRRRDERNFNFWWDMAVWNYYEERRYRMMDIQ